MSRTLLLAVCAGLSLVASAARSQPPPSTLAFITAAAQTDEFERREGRLAGVRAPDPRVRQFGRMMVTDHTRTTLALKAALRRAHLAIPPGPPVSSDQAQMIAQLTPLRGAAFDRSYVGQQVQVHQQALAVMQAYASGGDNPILRQAAANTIPIIRRHLAAAEQLAGGR